MLPSAWGCLKHPSSSAEVGIWKHAEGDLSVFSSAEYFISVSVRGRRLRFFHYRNPRMKVTATGVRMVSIIPW